MAKKTGKTKGQKQTPSNKRSGAGARAMAASKGGHRKTAGARTPQGKARRKQATNPPRPGKLKRDAGAGAAAAKTARTGRATGARGAKGGAKSAKAAGTRKTTNRAGGSGREETLAQTPETGRTRRGPSNPLPTKRSTGTGSGAGASDSPGLERARREQREIDETVPSPPSSLDLDSRAPSAARTGHLRLQDSEEEYTQTGPAMTGGDVDADWEDAYSVGEQAPGGDNPTPDQDIVEEIGEAIGVTYQDNEELKGADKVAERDRHRWELDPASSEDYKERE